MFLFMLFVVIVSVVVLVAELYVPNYLPSESLILAGHIRTPDHDGDGVSRLERPQERANQELCISGGCCLFGGISSWFARSPSLRTGS